MFSFSDYIREAHYDDVERLLDHAKQIGLSIKAITKNPHFVEDFADRDITINLSVDDLGFGFPVDQAREASKKYPNVHIRALGKNVEHIRLLSKEGIVDVITRTIMMATRKHLMAFKIWVTERKGLRNLLRLWRKTRPLNRSCVVRQGENVLMPNTSDNALQTAAPLRVTLLSLPR